MKRDFLIHLYLHSFFFFLKWNIQVPYCKCKKLTSTQVYACVNLPSLLVAVSQGRQNCPINVSKCSRTTLKIFSLGEKIFTCERQQKGKLSTTMVWVLTAHFEYRNLFIVISLPSYTNIPLIKMDLRKCKGEKKCQFKPNHILNQEISTQPPWKDKFIKTGHHGNLITLSKEVTLPVAPSCVEQITFCDVATWSVN